MGGPAARATSRVVRGAGSRLRVNPNTKLSTISNSKAKRFGITQGRGRQACVVTYASASGEQQTIVIGLAADSGCGKSTFMRRVTQLFGGDPEPPKGGNPDSNTLISENTTVICLDDYHCLDRFGRKEKGVTALAPEAQDFDLMYEQIKAIKEGKSVEKPIYNHVTGLLDPPETIVPPKILIVEGLHPFFDERVNDLIDFSIYLDISDEVKFAWKIQKDMAEVIVQVLPTQLIPDDEEKKVLRVKMIQKEGVECFEPTYLFDEGSTVSWIPCGRKLTCSFPGIKFFYGPDTFYGENVSVLDMDGQFDKLEELIYVESHLSNTSTKFYGEITQQLLKNQKFPGSLNGTGLFQTLCGLKIREVYERVTEKEVVPAN